MYYALATTYLSIRAYFDLDPGMSYIEISEQHHYYHPTLDAMNHSIEAIV